MGKLKKNLSVSFKDLNDESTITLRTVDDDNSVMLMEQEVPKSVFKIADLEEAVLELKKFQKTR